MGFTVAFPTGWAVDNLPSKVVAATPQKDAMMQLSAMAPPQGVGPKEFLTRNLSGCRSRRPSH
jgi:predicted Zn-dependent protease